MTVSLAFGARDLSALVVLGSLTLSYLAFHYYLAADRFRSGLAQRFGEETAEVGSVLRQRIGGGILLGGAAALAVAVGTQRSPVAYGLQRGDLRLAALLVAGVGLFLIPALFFAARNPQRWLTYPQMRLAVWNRRRWWQNTLAWGIYLLGYEFYFRGVLLGYTIELAGVWPGILLMTAIYCFVHLPKDAGETFGCFLMGIVFAVMARQTGAIWAPFCLHWLIATCSETFAMKANPAMAWRP